MARVRDRAAAGALVVLVHVGALYLVVTSRSVAAGHDQPTLATFNVVPPAPPSPPLPPPRFIPQPRAAAPAGVEGRSAVRTPVAAPVPVVPAPATPPVVAAVLPNIGAAAIGGTGDEGTGTGRGVGGWGTGAGGRGVGGTGGQRARLLSGAIRDGDYPRAARAARTEGIAVVRFTVGVDGHPRDCRIVTSAGDAALDTATCRLIEARFRYAPARDAAGEPVAEERGWRQRWWIEP